MLHYIVGLRANAWGRALPPDCDGPKELACSSNVKVCSGRLDTSNNVRFLGRDSD
jgi:hypothetical protein